MKNKDIGLIIVQLYLYADLTKKIHYTTAKNHMHELCDTVRDTILEFVDEFAEQMFGYNGKPKFNDFPRFESVKIKETTDITEICNSCTEVLELFYKENKDNDKLSGVISLIDDFKGDLNKLIFLSTFDKVSNY